MNRYLFRLATYCIATACSLNAYAAQTNHGNGASKQVKQYTIEQFMKTVRIGGAAFSPDDREILFHNNQSGIFNVYSLPVAGGPPKQLTHSTKDLLPHGKMTPRG